MVFARGQAFAAHPLTVNGGHSKKNRLLEARTMPDLADLFPGFASKWVDGPDGRLFARVGGGGRPLVLLHGYPQTHVCWHRIAPALARRFTVIAPDLRGYGWSFAPKPAPDGANYAKRVMAGDIIALAEELG